MSLPFILVVDGANVLSEFDVGLENGRAVEGRGRGQLFPDEVPGRMERYGQIERLFQSTTTQRRSRHSTDTVSEFHTEAPQATVSEGLAQGPYVAARAGFKPTTLWTKASNLPMSH